MSAISLRQNDPLPVSLDENLETRRFDFKGITGGKVDIKPGRYNIICYNNDTHGVDFP